LSKRAAASRAGFSEAVWRHLEEGKRQVGKGVAVPVNPQNRTLVSAAIAVGLDPDELLRLARREPVTVEVVEAHGVDDLPDYVIEYIEGLRGQPYLTPEFFEELTEVTAALIANEDRRRAREQERQRPEKDKSA
jgi:hypothetical protein